MGLALGLPVLANQTLVEVADTPTIKLRAYRSWIAEHLDGEPYHELAYGTSSRPLIRMARETWDSLPDSAKTLAAGLQPVSDLAPLPAGDVDTYHGPLPAPRPGAPGSLPEGGLFVAQGFADSPYLFGGANASAPPGTLELQRLHPLTLLWAPQPVRDEIRGRVFDLDLFAVPDASAPPGALQWADDLRPEYKIEPGLEDGDPSATEEVWLTVFRTAEWPATEELIGEAFERIDALESELHFKYVRGSVRKHLIEPLALRPDVVSITRQQYLVDRRENLPRWPRRSHRETHVARGPEPAPDDSAALLLRTPGESRRIWRVTDESLDRLTVDERQYWELLSDVVLLPNGSYVDLYEAQATTQPGYALDERRLVLLTSLWREGLDDTLEELAIRPVVNGSWEKTLFVDGHEQELLEALLVPTDDWAPADPDAPERFLRFVEPLRPEWKTLGDLSGVEPPAPTRIDLYRHPEVAATLALLDDLSRTTPIYRDVTVDWIEVHATLDVPARLAVARRPDVYRLEVEDSLPTRPTQPVLTVLTPHGALDEKPGSIGQVLRTASGDFYRMRREALDEMEPDERSLVSILSDDVDIAFGKTLSPWSTDAAGDTTIDVDGELGLWLVAPLVRHYTVPGALVEERLIERGLDLIAPPNERGFLVWGRRQDREGLGEITLPLDVVSQGDPSDPSMVLRWHGPWLPEYKLDPSLLAPAAPGEPIPTYQYVTVTARRHADSSATLERIESRSPTTVQSRSSVDTHHYWAWLDLPALDEIAQRGDVRSIGPPRYTPGYASEVRHRTVNLRTPPGALDPTLEGVQELWTGPIGPDGTGDDVTVVRITERLYDGLGAEERASFERLPRDIVLLSTGPAYGIDPIDEEIYVPGDLAMRDPEARSLWILQWVTFPRLAWLEWLEATGAEIVTQLEDSRAVIAWVTREQRAALAAHVTPPPFLEPHEDPNDTGEQRVIDWLGPYHPYFRLQAGLMDRLVQQGERLGVTVDVVPDSEFFEGTLAFMEEIGEVNGSSGTGRYSLTFDADRLDRLHELVHRPDVLGVYQVMQGGGPSGEPPADDGEADPPAPPFDPNDPPQGPSPAEIPVNQPLALTILAVVMALMAWRRLAG